MKGGVYQIGTTLVRFLGIVFFFIDCHISWYAKSTEAGVVSVQNKNATLCLVSNLRYQSPLSTNQMLPIDPWMEMPSNLTYKVQAPSYTTLDPEFLLFLKERLRNRKNILIKTQIFGLPESELPTKSFSMLKSPKSLRRYEDLAKLKATKPVISDVLKLYADLVDESTEMLYGRENPFSHDIADCDSYLYVTKYRSRQDSYNDILHFISFGILPEFRYQNHTYDLIFRPSKRSGIETHSYVIGYRRLSTLLFFPTFGLFDSVSSFDKEYQFSEESEEMFLDAVSETLERSL